jgi:hypothetical protein
MPDVLSNDGRLFGLPCAEKGVVCADLPQIGGGRGALREGKPRELKSGAKSKSSGAFSQVATFWRTVAVGQNK